MKPTKNITEKELVRRDFNDDLLDLRRGDKHWCDGDWFLKKRKKLIKVAKKNNFGAEEVDNAFNEGISGKFNRLVNIVRSGGQFYAWADLIRAREWAEFWNLREFSLDTKRIDEALDKSHHNHFRYYCLGVLREEGSYGNVADSAREVAEKHGFNASEVDRAIKIGEHVQFLSKVVESLLKLKKANSMKGGQKKNRNASLMFEEGILCLVEDIIQEEEIQEMVKMVIERFQRFLGSVKPVPMYSYKSIVELTIGWEHTYRKTAGDDECIFERFMHIIGFNGRDYHTGRIFHAGPFILKEAMKQNRELNAFVDSLCIAADSKIIDEYCSSMKRIVNIILGYDKYDHALTCL